MSHRNKYLATVAASLRQLNAFELLLMVSIIALAIISFVIKGTFTFNSCIAALSAVLGVCCVVLEAKGSMANWVFGIMECFLYTYISISGHIYGDALQRLLYTLPMQFVGWWMWSHRELGDGSTQIRTRYMTWRVRLGYLVLTATLTVALATFLRLAGPHLTSLFTYLRLHVQPSYASAMQLWLDAGTTVLSMIALYIAAKAYVEQWYVWVAINVMSIIIWAASPTDFSFMVVAKYSVYLVNSFYGIYMWHRLSKA